MPTHIQANRQLWNQWTSLHETSDFYDLASFKAGDSSLRPIELAELRDVAGKSLLHLQCHFGLDTLSWARNGALVTGVDLSDRAIALAQSLSAETGVPATFLCADIDNLPTMLSGQFEIIFTSYGVLHWLRDLRRWAEVIAHFLTPGGIFYIVEDHPFMRVFDWSQNPPLPDNPYFHVDAPFQFEARGSYAAPDADDTAIGYLWDHSLSDIVNAILGAGLRIEYLHEFPYHVRQKAPDMEPLEQGLWGLKERRGNIPFLFSLRATKA
jgi:SAM-dependent methyltransferase